MAGGKDARLNTRERNFCSSGREESGLSFFRGNREEGKKVVSYPGKGGKEGV